MALYAASCLAIIAELSITVAGIATGMVIKVPMESTTKVAVNAAPGMVSCHRSSAFHQINAPQYACDSL